MSTRPLNDTIRMTAGCLLAVLGLWGGVYSCGAGRGQWIYFHSRFGEEPESTDELLRRAEAADRAYPHNFYMARLSAFRALEAARQADHEDACLRYLNAADYWSQQALWLNPYRSEIQQLRCQVLEAEGRAAEAVEVWRAFVEREFWNPDHHAYLARLYLKAGRIDAAEASLQWTRRSREGRSIERHLRELRADESSRR